MYINLALKKRNDEIITSNTLPVFLFPPDPPAHKIKISFSPFNDFHNKTRARVSCATANNIYSVNIDNIHGMSLSRSYKHQRAAEGEGGRQKLDKHFYAHRVSVIYAAASK
jgi:hypothetical protein